MAGSDYIPFNKPYLTGGEMPAILEAHAAGRLAGDGRFTDLCHRKLEALTGARSVLLTHSCTAALEMAAILADLKVGDEVIMPSFTFVSTANAVVMRGAIPVFIDIRSDTLNMDESLIEDAISDRTRAILPVHYAGVACEMDAINRIARSNDLVVIEDAAQGVMSNYRGKALGTLGDLGAYSFHETKNIISGEGGALVVNRETLVGPAEIIREKGTDRSKFFRGEVDKYTWQGVGSSFLPGELVAAFLYAQLESAQAITTARKTIWKQYYEASAELESEGYIRRPVVPLHCEHNAHMYYVLLAEGIDRARVLQQLVSSSIHAVFHYVPLHNSPAGCRLAMTSGSMVNTEQLSERIIRLPMWVGLQIDDVGRIISELSKALKD